MTSNMQPQTTIELSQTKSEAEEEEERVEGEELELEVEAEEQQFLIGSRDREVNGDTALTSSSCKESRDNGEPPHQSSWPHGIFYLLSTLAVVGIAAIVSIFSSSDIRHQIPTRDGQQLNPLFEVQGRKDVKQQQISNYIKGTAIIRNIHITHHAGTSICGQMSRLGPTPSFACIHGYYTDNATLDHPWPTEEALANSHLNTQDANFTAEWVKFWRPYFHFMSNEYVSFGNLHKTNWEYENLVSMIVMRDPLERFLSGGKCGVFHGTLKDDPTEDNQDLYWEYANSACADNYALRVLANESSCAHGEDTSIACLESAKNLLKRFTFILDKSCLADSMVALGDALNLTITKEGFESSLHREHAPTRDRLGNDTLYEYVKRRFRRDIELYEWSKERSIVVCDDL